MRKHLKYLKSFTYLGSKINANATLDDEITNQIATATNAFGTFRHHLYNEKNIKLDTKIDICRTVVFNTLLNCSE